jgi:hypothetical protein
MCGRNRAFVVVFIRPPLRSDGSDDRSVLLCRFPLVARRAGGTKVRRPIRPSPRKRDHMVDVLIRVAAHPALAAPHCDARSDLLYRRATSRLHLPRVPRRGVHSVPIKILLNPLPFVRPDRLPATVIRSALLGGTRATRVAGRTYAASLPLWAVVREINSAKRARPMQQHCLHYSIRCGWFRRR